MSPGVAGPPPSDPPPTSSQAGDPRSGSTRRELLLLSGTAITATVAGCTVPGSDDSDGSYDGGNWHSFGNGPTNSNRVAGGAPEPTDHESLLSTDWSYPPPVVHDGSVYLATERWVGTVSKSGDEQWSQHLDAVGSGAPAIDPDKGQLYVPTRDVQNADSPDSVPASVTVLSTTDGTVRSEHHIGDSRTYGVTVVDNHVFARSASTCVKLTPDGTERWRRPLDPLSPSLYDLQEFTTAQAPPAVTGDAVYTPVRDALVKLDPATGEEDWRVPVDTPLAAPSVNERGVVQTGWKGTVAVDHSGDVRWRRDLHTLAAAAVDGDTIYIVTPSALYELDGDSGETNWQTHLPDGATAPVVTDDTVLVVSGGELQAFHRDDSPVSGRERWRTASVGLSRFTSPVVAAGRIFVIGSHGLLAFRA